MSFIIDYFKSLSAASNPAATPPSASAPPSSPAQPSGGWAPFHDAAFWATTLFESGSKIAQVTGNFDGTGLTCGFMGWTVLYGGQQKLVKKFVSMFGEAALLSIMPETGAQYIKAMNSTTDAAMKIVSTWSKDSTVYDPYRSELKKFWNDPRMVQIQKDEAYADMGAYACKLGDEFCKAYSASPNQNIYAFFYDTKVLNGGMSSVAMDPALSDRGFLRARAYDAVNWCKERSGGYLLSDVHRNAALWKDLIENSPSWQLQLFVLGHRRSLLSKEEFKGVTMCRRGALAFGRGWVNESLFTY